VGAAFFCVSNDLHFVGAATLLNSLRELGHDEPFYLVDCGLTDRQRDVLATHVTFVPAPTDVPPLMLKAHGPVEVDPDVAVILDADVIVTRPLTDWLDGKPVVFLNDLTERFRPEWSRLGYGRLRRIPYLNSGHMIFPRESGLARLMQQGNKRLLEIVRDDPSQARVPTDAFYYTDQDVLNALIGSLDPDDYVVSDEVSYWPFEQPVANARFLHHILDKPWLKPLRPNTYSREMTRLLAAGPVEVPVDEIPAQLRPGAIGSVARARGSLQHTLRDHTRGRLGIRRRLAERKAATEQATTG
jgi:hypothetical protein